MNNEKLEQLQHTTLYGLSLLKEGESVSWQNLAAIYDDSNPQQFNPDALRNQLCIDWDNVQITDSIPIPQAPGESWLEVLKTQHITQQALRYLPLIAKETGNTLLTGLLEYGLSQDTTAGQLLSQLQNDPPREDVRPFRLDVGMDTAGVGRIFEAQIGMAGLDDATFINATETFIPAFLTRLRKALGKRMDEEIHIAIALTEDIFSRYFAGCAAFGLAVEKKDPLARIHIVSNGGFTYSDNKLHYANTISEKSTPVDVVFRIPDMRRFLTADMLPLLEAVRDRSVEIVPDFNAASDNYHLWVRICMNEPKLQPFLLEALRRVGVDNPQQFIANELASQTLPMLLVHKDGMCDLAALGLGEGKLPWPEVIARLKDESRGEKFPNRRARERLIIRSVLSQDTHLLSGGFSMQRIDPKNVSTQEMIERLEESLAGIEELERDGKTNKTILGVQALQQQPAQAAQVQNTSGDITTITDTILRCCIFSFPLDNQPQIDAAVATVGRRSGGFRIGGDIFAKGSVVY